MDTLAFANFSQALVKARKGHSSGLYGSMTVDYSKQELSLSEDTRTKVGKQLSTVGEALQRAFKGPQDVEGALVGDRVYIVQARPQP